MTARVLIVDDIPTNVRLLEARLTAEYFEVRTASSGPEALAICTSQDIDIVLLDVMMPDMDGFEVCKRLKANSRTHHVPVLMVTALDQPSDRVKGLEAGADDFLADTRTQMAVTMALVIIGESAGRIMAAAPDFVTEHSEISWVEMKGLRNLIAHDYFNLELKTIWQSTQTNLPDLIFHLKSIRHWRAEGE